MAARRAAIGPRARITASARARTRATRVHARPRERAVTGPRGRASTRTHDRVRTDAIFTARTRFLPRPRVTADAGGRLDDVRGRPDGHFHPKTSVMTSLLWLWFVQGNLVLHMILFLRFIVFVPVVLAS
jgi:hypothetical protein